MILTIVADFLTGLVIGSVAYALMPSARQAGIFRSALVGIAGSLVGGIALTILVGTTGGLLGAIAGSMVVIGATQPRSRTVRA